MKILNLYAGLGGNRKLWSDEHEVTAVESNNKIAEFYQDQYKNDNVIIADAKEFLLNNYMLYDFIWCSPPCQTHSRARFWSSKPNNKVKPVYPDMTLYELILFLENYFDGIWCVENVIPYYDPLIKPKRKLGRHLFWSNFYIKNNTFEDADINRGNIKEYQDLHRIDISKYNFNTRKDQLLRNCVNPELGKHILDCAMNKNEDTEQLTLF